MSRTCCPGWFAVAAATAMLACTTSSTRVGTAGEFVAVDELDAMERGTSTRRDVQRALGAPDGSGHALLPGDPTPLDLWYYDDIEITNLRRTREGGFHAQARQQMLVVTFRGDLFDGYMWWSNAGRLTSD